MSRLQTSLSTQHIRHLQKRLLVFWMRDGSRVSAWLRAAGNIGVMLRQWCSHSPFGCVESLGGPCSC
jgi:hypothetical protein